MRSDNAPRSRRNRLLVRFGLCAFRVLFSAGNPGTPKKFYEAAIVECQRKTLATLWHVLSFFTTYATIDEYNAAWQLPDHQKNLVDRWLLSRVNRLVSDVVQLMDQYDYYSATVAIDSFIEELSNWFIRTSRRRFWKSEQDSDKTSAYVSLYETLWTLSKLIAPFVPFIAEHMNSRSGKNCAVFCASQNKAAAQTTDLHRARTQESRT